LIRINSAAPSRFRAGTRRARSSPPAISGAFAVEPGAKKARAEAGFFEKGVRR
jgi:hypothetical protein